jgi:hypothetical protein
VAGLRFAGQPCLFILLLTQQDCSQFSKHTNILHHHISLCLPRRQISKTADQRIIILSIGEFLYRTSTTMAWEHAAATFGVIDLASTVTTARGVPTSSTPPPPQQWLERLRHHQPRLRHNDGSRGSGIIDPVSAATMARGAPTSSTPPLPQQWFEGL